PGPQEAIEVHAQHEVGASRRRRPYARVVEPAIQRVKARAPPQRTDLYAVTELGEAVIETRDPHEGTAALAGIERRGGQNGDAQKRSGAAGRRLAALKARRPLLHERARSLLVVLAVEGLDAQRAEMFAVRVRDAVEDGLDLGLGAAHGERGVGGHRPEIVVGE